MTVPLQSARALRRQYERREASAVEIVRAALANQAEHQAPLNAFFTTTPDHALAAAHAADAIFARGGEAGPLAGIPIAVKDLIDVAGVRSTYGAAIFADHTATETAFVVDSLAGAALVGKAATHEFAWGITSENPHFGTCRNPWDPTRIAGGSSGGSAVAVATAQAVIALGTDTAGSIRIPAAYCGVIGFKPTYGLVPVDGIFPLAPSLDHAGVLARTTDDVRAVLDLWQVLRPIDRPTKPRIGLLERVDAPEPTAAIAGLLDRCANQFASLGADVKGIRFDPPHDPVSTLAAVQGVEAFDTHSARGLYPANADQYGDDVRSRLERSSTLTLADYLAAMRARRDVNAAMGRLFEDVDFLLSLVSPVPPPLIGETDDLRDLVLPYTVLQSLGGLPACAFPIGFDNGLPVAAQLTGPRFSDYRVLEVVESLVPEGVEVL